MSTVGYLDDPHVGSTIASPRGFRAGARQASLTGSRDGHRNHWKHDRAG
jgi:hypothetical protein